MSGHTVTLIQVDTFYLRFICDSAVLQGVDLGHAKPQNKDTPELQWKSKELLLLVKQNYFSMSQYFYCKIQFKIEIISRPHCDYIDCFSVHELFVVVIMTPLSQQRWHDIVPPPQNPLGWEAVAVQIVWLWLRGLRFVFHLHNSKHYCTLEHEGDHPPFYFSFTCLKSTTS